MNLGLHLLENPNGTYSFVGSVPCELAYTTKAGNIVSAEEVTKQMMLPSNYRTIKSRVFQTEFEAWNEAARLGYAKKEII